MDRVPQLNHKSAQRPRQKSNRYPLSKCQDEWIGDAVLGMLVRMVMAERHPDEYPENLKRRVHAYLQNKLLSRFCTARDFDFGANGFERLLCRTIQSNFNQARQLVRDLFEFATKEDVERTYRQMNIAHNRHRQGSRPHPCRCGSLNLHMRRFPFKITCRDCSFEFTPFSPVDRTSQMIDQWNAYWEQTVQR